MTDVAQPESTEKVVSITALIAQAATKSGIVWVEAPNERPHAVWFVWHDDEDPRSVGPALYVVSGPGEQTLPWLPGEVTVHFKSKDTGGLLLSVKAAVAQVSPDSPQWSGAVEALKAGRLNSTGDVDTRWREHCTIHALSPMGRPLQGPTDYDTGARADAVTPVKGTTTTWRPWHAGNRATALRNRKR